MKKAGEDPGKGFCVPEVKPPQPWCSKMIDVFWFTQLDLGFDYALKTTFLSCFTGKLTTTTNYPPTS